MSTPAIDVDYYETLQISKNADQETVQRVFRLLAQRFHPDNLETGDEAPNPLPSKAMLRHLDQPVGHCRPPLGPDPEWLEPRAADVYSRLVAARGNG